MKKTFLTLTLAFFAISISPLFALETGQEFNSPENTSIQFPNGSQQDDSPNSAEDAFLGVGADMEEFFTGERTIDQEESDPEDKTEDNN